MCLAVPGKVIFVDESNPEMRTARVRFGEVEREICIQWLEDVNPGDYILAHVGTALSKVDEKEARITLEALREMWEAEQGS
jgi:hydrogenase expression/formation protein HypC